MQVRWKVILLQESAERRTVTTIGVVLLVFNFGELAAADCHAEFVARPTHFHGRSAFLHLDSSLLPGLPCEPFLAPASA
jgi:hypothetical protein